MPLKKGPARGLFLWASRSNPVQIGDWWAPAVACSEQLDVASLDSRAGLTLPDQFGMVDDAVASR